MILDSKIFSQPSYSIFLKGFNHEIILIMLMLYSYEKQIQISTYRDRLLQNNIDKAIFVGLFVNWRIS